MAALALLSLITGYISYLHGFEIATIVGNPQPVALALPLVPDLMIVTSSMTLIEARANDLGRPWTAMLALIAGIGWTVAQNVAAGLHDSPGNALISAGVPLAFIATFESLLWQFRQARAAGQEPPLVTGPFDVASAMRQLVTHYGSQRAAADELRIPRDHLRKLIAVPEPLAEKALMNGTSHD